MTPGILGWTFTRQRSPLRFWTRPASCSWNASWKRKRPPVSSAFFRGLSFCLASLASSKSLVKLGQVSRNCGPRGAGHRRRRAGASGAHNQFFVGSRLSTFWAGVYKVLNALLEAGFLGRPRFLGKRPETCSSTKHESGSRREWANVFDVSIACGD